MLAKQIQWNWPETYGEDDFVIMLESLHAEMAFLKCLGNWFAGSGWTNAITKAWIATSGTANALLKASHVTCARYSCQVSASSLHLSLHEVLQGTMMVYPKNMPSILKAGLQNR